MFITNGSCIENSANGDHAEPAAFTTNPASYWQMWRSIAKQNPAFGNSDHYCTGEEITAEYSVRSGMAAVYTLLDIDRSMPEVLASVYDVCVLRGLRVRLLY